MHKPVPPPEKQLAEGYLSEDPIRPNIGEVPRMDTSEEIRIKNGVEKTIIAMPKDE